MNIDREKVDSLVFDMDGTLWDAMKSYAEVWNVAFRELGLPISVDENVLKAGIGYTIDDILVMLLNRYGVSIDDERFLARVDEIEDELLPVIGGVPYDGMQAGIRRLSEHYKIFLLSNCGPNGLPNFMRFTGIEDCVTDYLSYGMRQKSKSENLLYLKQKHGLAMPVYVGDTQSDCNNAHLAGMPFVYASYGFGKCEGYDLRVDKFVDIVEYFIDTINNK
ncbi:MAG: HAD family hydrolase [Muribaculaceae bacterium]